jgi:hypothetical protein
MNNKSSDDTNNNNNASNDNDSNDNDSNDNDNNNNNNNDSNDNNNHADSHDDNDNRVNSRNNKNKYSCKCGNVASIECTLKTCNKCCTDTECFRHRKKHNAQKKIIMENNLKVNKLMKLINDICEQTNLKSEYHEHSFEGKTYKFKISLRPFVDEKNISGTDFEIMQFVKDTLLENNVHLDDNTKKLIDNIEKCECCRNMVRYKLVMQEDVKCPYCRYVKYKKYNEKMSLCSTKCDHLYWWPVTYLTDIQDKNIKVTYCLEKDECIKCGRRDFPEVLFSGVRIF